ncbi:MAG: hypothetical protein JXA49_05675, partial [Actinobacteria bacterium]|nr:hypothetical protein [Actinomycetota bacterium]
MRKTIVLLTVISFLATGLIPAFAGVALADAPVINRDYAGLESPGLYYPDPYGLFWDLTRGDLTISYKLDMSGFTPPQGNQDWTEIGLYSSSGRTGWINSGAPGAYLGDTDLHDSNDKLSLNSVFRENEEWSYNATGPETLISDWGIPWKPWLNCGIWFDRGHVDTGQSQQGGLYDGGTYNTGGVYDVSITYHAIDNAAGTMFATVNGVPTGFYSASHQGDPDYSPVGKTFYGDMTREAVYAKVMGEGVKISDFSISGCPGEPQLYGIWPTTAEQGESLKDMFFNGAQFRDVPITAQLSNPNTGETAVAGRTVYVANFQIRADIDIPETATVGLWDADCWHNDDTEAVATLPQSFMVTNATPRINAIDNNHCRPGANITMAVTGKYFRNTPMTIKLLRGGEILEGKNIKW